MLFICNLIERLCLQWQRPNAKFLTTSTREKVGRRRGSLLSCVWLKSHTPSPDTAKMDPLPSLCLSLLIGKCLPILTSPAGKVGVEPNHATAKKHGILLYAYSMIATWFRSVCSYWNRVGLKNANLYFREV